jgi:hypothetical protein
VPEKLEVRLLEQVDVGVILEERAEEEGVNAEEGAELLVKVGLLDVRAGRGRYPEVLRVALKRILATMIIMSSNFPLLISNFLE